MAMQRIILVTGIVLAGVLGAVTHATAAEIPTPKEVRAAIGTLGDVPVPANNPLTKAKVELGRRLFEDDRLAGDGSQSCKTCHLPDHGFATPLPLGPAYPSQMERRNSPTLINVAFNLPLLWDGRAESLDKQALGPVTNILHLNNNPDLLVQQLKTDPSYMDAFAKAFPAETITPKHVGQAIGSYERTLVYDHSPLDDYMDGKEDALTSSQKRGLALFMGKANCITCHRGPNLTDNKFHNLGVPDDRLRDNPRVLASIRFDAKRMGLPGWAALHEDPGRELVTHDAADRGKFRTMGLRNIEASSPYMHNGAFATLDEVVRFYNAGGGDHPNKSNLVKPLGLSDSEVHDLVAFLKALTGSRRKISLK